MSPGRSKPPVGDIAPESEQFERPYWPDDPVERARIEQEAAREAMRSERQSFSGAADGVGSVGFEDRGAYDVTAETRATVFGPNSGPPESAPENAEGYRTDREVRDRDPGDGAGSLSPDQPGVTSAAEGGDADLGGAPAPNVTGRPARTEADEMRAQADKRPGPDGHEL